MVGSLQHNTLRPSAALVHSVGLPRLLSYIEATHVCLFHTIKHSWNSDLTSLVRVHSEITIMISIASIEKVNHIIALITSNPGYSYKYWVSEYAHIFFLYSISSPVMKKSLCFKFFFIKFSRREVEIFSSNE